MLESSNQPRGAQYHRMSRRRSSPPSQPSDPRRQRVHRRDPATDSRSDLRRLPADHSAAAPEPSVRSRQERIARIQQGSGKLAGQPSRVGQRQTEEPLSVHSSANSKIYRTEPTHLPSQPGHRQMRQGINGKSPQADPRLPLSKRRPEASPASPSRQVRGLRPVSAAPIDRVRKSQLRQQRPQRPVSPLIHIVRLLILGVGVGAIAGTALSAWKPTLRHSSAAVQTIGSDSGNSLKQSPEQSSLDPLSSMLGHGQEMTALSAKIAPLTQGLTNLTPGIFLIDLDNSNYLTLNGTMIFSSASMIKVPILITFFQDVDAGKIRLDERLTMQQGDIASGSGEMQYDGVGTQYSVLDVITQMIVNSDNTATNMVIRRLGGIEALNQRFRQLGLQQTVMHSLLPDLEGTNITTPKELVSLLVMVSQGELVSMKSRDRLLEIMRHTATDSLLPASLGPGATISHKTGDIGSLVGDTGLVDMPSGKRYAIAVLVKRPHNDSRAQDLIRQVSSAVYEYLNNPDGTHSIPGAGTPGLETPSSGTSPNSPASNDAIDAPSPQTDAPSTANPNEAIDSQPPAATPDTSSSPVEPEASSPDSTSDPARADSPDETGSPSDASSPEANAGSTDTENASTTGALASSLSGAGR